MTDLCPAASTVTGYRVLRGAADGPLFLVLDAVPDTDESAWSWTGERAAATLFASREAADTAREAVLLASGHALAVVPGPGCAR